VIWGAAGESAAESFRRVTIRAIHADGDTVIVIWDGRGIASDGQPYENSYATAEHSAAMGNAPGQW
jgi:ketosteroid isomerase-like protein